MSVSLRVSKPEPALPHVPFQLRYDEFMECQLEYEQHVVPAKNDVITLSRQVNNITEESAAELSAAEESAAEESAAELSAAELSGAELSGARSVESDPDCFEDKDD